MSESPSKDGVTVRISAPPGWTIKVTKRPRPHSDADKPTGGSPAQYDVEFLPPAGDLQ